jgi:NAD-dependent dihydropyrimidine dehydrogenase PreA subunit
MQFIVTIAILVCKILSEFLQHKLEHYNCSVFLQRKRIILYKNEKALVLISCHLCHLCVPLCYHNLLSVMPRDSVDSRQPYCHKAKLELCQRLLPVFKQAYNSFEK